MDPLKFQIAIENKNALNSIKAVQDALNNLSGKTLTINAEGLQGLSDLIKSIGKDGGVVKIQLPDLSHITDQLKTMKGVTDALFSKQNWQDIPAFTKALAQVSQLSTALDELASKKNIALNSGRNSATSNGILGLQASLAEMFQQLPNTNIKSALEYFKQFQIEFDKLKEKMQTPIGSAIAKGTQAEFEKLRQQFDAIGNLANTSGGLKEFQTQIKTIVATLVQGMVEVQQAIRQAKNEIQNDNFSAFSKRIENAAISMNGLVEAFGKFNLTIGQDQSLKDFMIGLGEVIRNVRTTMSSLTGEAGSGKIFSTVTKSIEQAKYEFYEFTELMRKAAATSRLGKQFSDVDTAPLDKAIERLNQYRSVLLDLKRSGYNANEQTTSEFKQTAAYKEAVAEVKKLVAQTEALESNQRRYNAMLKETQALKDRINSAQTKGMAVGADVTGMSSAWLKAYQFKEKLQSLSEKDQKNTHIINELAAEYMKLSQALTRAAKEQEKLNAATEKKQKKDTNDRAEQLRREESNLRRVLGAYEEAERLMSRLTSTANKGFSLGLDITKISSAINELDQFIKKMGAFDQTADNHATTELIGNFNILRRSLVEAAKAQDQLNNAKERAKKDAQSESQKQAAVAAKLSADAAKQAQRENEKWAASQAKAGEEANKLEIKIRELQRVEQSGSAVGVDTSKLKAYIRDLETYKAVLESIANGYKGVGHTSDWLSGRQTVSGAESLGNTTRLANEASAAVQKLTNEKKQAAGAANQLTAEQQRLAQALNQTTESARGQSQILSDLKSMAMQYLGVWGGQQFLRNIIEIGGQLEMQRLSIGAILQNQSQANDLFENIKGLALQSPFGVVQLDQMTKQLTAYGFKYSELYDMTKRLADISAATGTGVDRLALALGHVRSEAALSGYTLRQFSMGNVPLLQKLSEKLGKTTQEIRKMVRSKEISYEDVIGVIKDLTNEGGMFYNMQEVISQSVKARFKNVKDAMDIMYGEMAEGGIGDLLKGIAETLMDVTRNWKDAATILGTGAAVWATQRIAVMAYTSAVGKSNMAVISSIAAHRQKEAAILRDAAGYRALTIAESQQLAMSKKLTLAERAKLLLGGSLSKARTQSLLLARRQQTADVTLALSQKKLTTEMVLRQVAYGKLSKAQAVQIFNSAKLTLAEKRAALAALQHTQQLKGLSLALDVVGYGIKKVALALGAMTPQLLFMGAITALMELWQSHNRQMERAEELGQSIYQQSQDAIKSTRTLLKEYDATLSLNGNEKPQLSDLNLKTVPIAKIEFPEMDSEDAERAIEEWTQYIRDYTVNSGDILNKSLFDTNENLLTMEERFNNLRAAMSDVILAQFALQDLDGVFENAVKSTNSDFVIDDDVIENIKDYAKSLKDADKEIAKAYGKSRSGIDQGIAFAKEHNKAFADATKDIESYGEAFSVLMKRYEEFPEAIAMVQDFANFNFSESNMRDSIDEAESDRKAMMDDLQTFYIQLRAELETKGVDVENMSNAQQQALLLGYKKTLEQTGNLSEEMMKELMILFAHKFNIPLNLDDEKFVPKLDEAKRLLGELVNGEWKVDLTFATNIKDVIDEARKQYKAAKEFYANAEPVMLKFGIKMKIGDTLTDEQIAAIVAKAPAESKEFLKQLLMGANEASKLFNQATEASKNGGFSLEDPTKKKKEKKKNGSKKAYKDPEVEKWKERMKNLKAAYDEYEKLEKEFGHDEAILRVKRAFKGLIDEGDIDNIKEYRKELVEIKNKALDRYASQKKDKSKDYGKQAQQLAREAEKAINDIDLGEQKRRSDEYLSKLKLQLDELKKQWETFNKVRTATGNEEIAAHVAGLSQDQASKRDIANSVKANIQGIIKEMGDEVKVPIKFDVKSSDKDIENNVKAALGGSEKYREQIKGITEAIKTWRDLERDAMQKSVDAYTQAVSKAMDYESQLARINAELAEQNRLIDENSNLSQEEKDRAKGINQANAGMKALEAGDSYKRFFNNIFGETKTELQGMANTIKTQLNYSLKTGAITAEEYAKKIKDVDEVMKQSEIGNPDAWYNKGIFNTETMEQRNQRLYGEGNEKMQEGADTFIRGLMKGDDAMKKAGKEMMQNGQNMMNGANKAALTMAIIDKVVHGIDQSIQGTVKAFDYLKETLDSLGVESDTMSSVGDYLHTLGEMSSHVTQSWDNFKNGNFIGAGVEAFGAVTSVIKGISQAHDNRLERAINKLREDVKVIEANTELIAKARERTLGYDMGDVRRQMAQQYATTQYSGKGNVSALLAMLLGNNNQNKSMYEYYTKNSQGSGYQQEYENLVEQRKKYMEILKDQQDKKKKSNDEIEETKAKIAELDDQIAYFSQDLAKELWSIDIKGWADQLSDALASAFENGENMAKAYRDTVTQIIQQMMQKMMQMAILEPMFERLQKQLFGENGKGGVFDPNNPKGSMSKVTAMIADFFGKGGEGEKAITASMEFMTAFQRGMQNAGLTVLNEASNTLSSSMQGTTEETSGLLAGYVNALRQDVSVNRILLTQFVSQMWPDYIETFASQVTAVQNIDTNVQVIMTMMQMGNGAMYNEIAAMRARIDNVVMGIDRFSIR